MLQDLEEIEVKNIAYPLLFLPFVSRASEIIGKRIFLKLDEKEYLLNFNQSILSNHLNSEVNEKAKLINLKFLNNENSFTIQEWENLYKLSENTFVEEIISGNKALIPSRLLPSFDRDAAFMTINPNPPEADNPSITVIFSLSTRFAAFNADW